MIQFFPRNNFSNEADRHSARMLSVLIPASWLAFIIIFFGGTYYHDRKLLVVTVLIGIVQLASFLFRRKQIEEALRLSEKQLKSYIDHAGDAIYVLDAKSGRIVNCNMQACRDLGYTRDELLGMSAKDIEAHLKAEEIDAVLGRAALNNATLMEGVHKRKDNSTFPVEIHLSLLDLAQQEHLIAIVRDITERKRSEEKLLERDAKLRALFDSAGYSISVAKNGVQILGNPAFVKLFGLKDVSEIPGTLLIELIAPEERERIKAYANRGAGGVYPTHYETKGMRKDGSVFDMDVRISTYTLNGELYTVGFQSDITERKKMEEAVRNAQKLEALGLLAGGIAHDFNNLMGGIFGYIDLASGGAKDEKVTNYLSKAMNTIDRARGLTQQLLTFAKGGAPIRHVGSLFPLVRETAQFALSGSNVSCNYDIADDLWACNFDKNQIGQVIDNIVINAQQAMFSGGTIELTARNIAVAEGEHPILGKGNYVRISIKDSGVGIPKEMIGRIFDPFFTTKAKGHGLGLATCYSIVNRHGGCIDVESEPGKGAVFHVYLPASTETADFSNKESEIEHAGSGTVLVMDDEEVMQDAIHDMLVSFGYSVVCKENGKEAVDFYAMELRAKRTLSGMIFDLTVPGGMGGKDAVREIRKLNAEIPIFVSSGYANDPVMKNPAEYGFTASICKPFTKVELAQMLNKHLKSA